MFSSVHVGAKLSVLEKRLNTVEEKIDNILHILSQEQNIMHDVGEAGKKMSKHIDFVESVYMQVRYPLEIVCKSITKMCAIPSAMWQLESDYTLSSNGGSLGVMTSNTGAATKMPDSPSNKNVIHTGCE